MKIDRLLYFSLPIAHFAISAPTESASSELEARDMPTWIGVYMCPQHDWQPIDECFWNRLAINEELHSDCFSFADPNTSDQMSFGPDLGVWCAVYTAPSCIGNGLQLEYPGTPDLGTAGAQLAGKSAGSIQKFSSFSCGLHKCAVTESCDSSLTTEHSAGPPPMREEEMPPILTSGEESERLGKDEREPAGVS